GGQLAFSFDATLCIQPGDDNYYVNVFPDLLVITANDRLYVYDMVKMELWRISPEGYRVTRLRLMDHDVVMTLVPEPVVSLGGPLSVYQYDIPSRKGKFVVKNVKP